MSNEGSKVVLISAKLLEISSFSGAPHLIDNEVERNSAIAYIEQQSKIFGDGSTYETNILSHAADVLKKNNGEVFQINQLFNDLLGSSCTGFSLYGNYFRIRTSDVELVTPLEKGAYAVFHISDGGGGPLSRTHIISISKEEWSIITAPFRQNFTPDYAIALSVSIFEKIVGPKAGTSGDIGGENGNRMMSLEFERSMDRRGRVPNTQGQQDCINEAQTTRGLVLLLSMHNLTPFKILNDGIENMSNEHEAVLVTETSTGDRWVIDSWPRDNGEMPDVVPLKQWRSKQEGKYLLKGYDTKLSNQ